jgi:hypothetical protein
VIAGAPPPAVSTGGVVLLLWAQALK